MTPDTLKRLLAEFRLIFVSHCGRCRHSCGLKPWDTCERWEEKA